LKNLLFVCSRNKWRSLTAEKVFSRQPGIDVKSAGTEPSARIKVTVQLLSWADIILVMEKEHKVKLCERFPDIIRDKELYVLDIPDKYRFMDPELIEELKIAVSAYI
jgi:predicted protein tyrosine phosphatase